MTVTTVEDLTSWCSKTGLSGTSGRALIEEDLAILFRYSPDVVFAWTGEEEGFVLPARLRRLVDIADAGRGLSVSKLTFSTDALVDSFAGLTVGEFFDWCAGFGFVDADGNVNTKEVAKIFMLSPQTIRNWRRGEPETGLSTWVSYVMFHYDLTAELDDDGGWVFPDIPEVSVESVKDWRSDNTLTSYEDVGAVFGITRQAVYNWYNRGRFPKWLGLACAGHRAVFRSNKGKVLSTRDSSSQTRMNGDTE